MKTKTQRLIDECRRAPQRVRTCTAARILQSLGETRPHKALHLRPRSDATHSGLLFTEELHNGIETGLWVLEPYPAKCFCGQPATRASSLYGKACDEHAPYDEPLPGFEDRVSP